PSAIKLIPDAGVLNGTVRVSSIASAITNVKVAMHILHTNNADLDIFLVAPDGTKVELSTDNGSTGDNLGVGCTSQAQQIVFDQAAGTLASAMPATGNVVGSFKPEGTPLTLASLNGKNPNGTWKLEVTDDASSNVGVLGCWTLIL